MRTMCGVADDTRRSCLLSLVVNASDMSTSMSSVGLHNVTCCTTNSYNVLVAQTDSECTTADTGSLQLGTVPQPMDAVSSYSISEQPTTASSPFRFSVAGYDFQKYTDMVTVLYVVFCWCMQFLQST